ncbi:UPF0345 protein [Enterococcus florum]|uniref:Pyrimidine/purine nucleoside phosphorylase n=1 Tax=Enterococcus florum TaxID=2480627 RepID=A0A4P5PFG3_9ENTE|nr:pyrimidine/purine nucleoside phosphorylase [Enterococcus florum]GCF94988.1 UPF0345 protein [Enterococcus florum]
MFKNVNAETKANIYFDGKVTSRTLYLADGQRVTLGFMLPGEYTFGTNEMERMVVTQGTMTVLLPNQKEWLTISASEEFIVPANSEFQVKVATYADYTCSYLSEE